MSEPLTLTAYARRRGVSVKAVSKAIASGRLVESVARDRNGAPKIADPDLADREWVANTRSSMGRPPVGVAAEEGPPPVPVPRMAPPPRGAPDPTHDPSSPSGAIDEPPPYHDSRARREAQAARREAALADMAELDVAERRGQLVPVDEARAEVQERYTLVRTRLLGVPSRVAQRLPHVAAEVVPVLDELLREALEELALEDDATHDGATP